MKNSQFKAALSLVAIASLAACGGGGGDDHQTETPVATVDCAITVADTSYGAAGGGNVQTSAGVCTDLKTIAGLLSARINGLNSTLSTIAQFLASAPTAESVATLQARVAELQAQLATSPAGSMTELQTQIDALQRSLATALTADQVAGLQTQVTTLTGLLDDANKEIDRLNGLLSGNDSATQIATLTGQVSTLMGQVGDLTKELEGRPTQAMVDGLNGQIGALQNQVTELQAAVASGGGNTTGLPFCTPSTNPITATTTFPGSGSANVPATCVVSYADQKALAVAIQAALDEAAANAASVKVDGIYFSDTLFMVVGADGKTWILDQKTPDATFGSINVAGSTGNTFSAPNKSFGYTHRDVAVSGSYVKKSSATFTMAYSAYEPDSIPASTVSHQAVYDAAFDTALVLPVKTMPGQDFYTGSHDLALTVDAGGTTFTGYETGPNGTCTFTGTFAATGKGYNNVSITWGANCAVPAGTVGSGVIAKYDANYVLMTNQTGNFGTYMADVGFVAIFEGGAAPVALKLGDKATALRATRAGAR